MRASVLIHLPGLVLTKEIGKVLAGLQQMGLTYRGLYGEGSEVVGNFFQISNQTTLGRSEEDLLDQLCAWWVTSSNVRKKRDVFCCATRVILSKTSSGARTARCVMLAASRSTRR